MATEQRRNITYPWTWELPATGVAVMAMVLVLGVHVGRGLACWLSGGGLAWTTRTELFTSLSGILGGDPNAGLSHPIVGVSAASLGWSIGIVEVLLLASSCVVGWAVMVRWGPAAMKGVATAGEAERLLGRSRLRRVRRIIRPDLHPRRRLCLPRIPRSGGVS